MKVLCTVKKIVDPEVKVKLNDGQIDPSSLDYKLNPFDEYGVEEAIKLKEAGHADEVVVVSVGSADVEKEIRTALAMGADRAIRVNVDDHYGMDTLGTSKLLAAVAKKEEPDMIILGKLSTDTEGNQVGQMIAQLCGYAQATFAYSLEVGDGVAIVGREVDGGTATVKVQLPAVITADLRLNEPRYASLPGIMKAKRKPLEVIEADDLGVEYEAKVTSVKYEAPPERSAGEVVEDVATLVDRLANDAKVI